MHHAIHLMRHVCKGSELELRLLDRGQYINVLTLVKTDSGWTRKQHPAIFLWRLSMLIQHGSLVMKGILIRPQVPYYCPKHQFAYIIEFWLSTFCVSWTPLRKCCSCRIDSLAKWSACLYKSQSIGSILVYDNPQIPIFHVKYRLFKKLIFFVWY